MYGIKEYLAACNDRRKFLLQQLAWLKEERQQHDADAGRLQDVLHRSGDEMAGYLIPEVSDEFLADLENRLAFPGLLSIKRDFEQRFDEAEKRRIELAAMPEIEHYEIKLRELDEKIKERHPEYDQVRSDIAYWHHSKWHRKLEKAGYYESDYRPGWFRRFFDWRSVSFLIAELAKQADLKFDHPDKLKEHYRVLRDKAHWITTAYEVLGEDRDRLVALKQEYEDTLAAPERLLAELYQALGAATVEHLLACPEDLRIELAGQDRTLNTFLRKHSGLTKQVQYLRELAVARIDSRLQQLDIEIAKINAKIQKLEMQRRRGKRKRYSKADIDRMRAVKADKWARRHAKTTKMRRRISQFDDYDRGSFVGGYLWWDVMTNASAADDIYEVREHRMQNPDWDHRRFRDPTDQADGIRDDDQGIGVIDDAAEALASSMASDATSDLYDPS
ncbi:MAG: hypothetical protein HKN47_03550 [Pirellulaceae bacterium]|nr:hypothetical protein [Pirellulaceae bacterium]